MLLVTYDSDVETEGTYSATGNLRNVKRLGRDSGDGDGEDGSEDGGLHDCDL